MTAILEKKIFLVSPVSNAAFTHIKLSSCSVIPYHFVSLKTFSQTVNDHNCFVSFISNSCNCGWP